jgi:hypothetical protein
LYASRDQQLQNKILSKILQIKKTLNNFHLETEACRHYHQQQQKQILIILSLILTQQVFFLSKFFFALQFATAAT